MSVPDNLSVRVVLSGGSGADWHGTLSEFIEQNRGEFTLGEIDAIATAIERGEVYTFNLKYSEGFTLRREDGTP